MAGRRVIGFDAGGTKLLGGVVSADGRVHHRVHRLIQGLEREELLAVMVDAVDEARAAAPDCEAVGFGIPSVIDRANGLSVASVHLPLDDFAFGEAMSERLGVPVAWDNDTNVAMIAEQRLGAAGGASEALMLTLGTGIGGAVVIGGRLYRGSVGGAGELGHTVIDIDGPPCQGACPNRGCLEVMASGTAIGREGARVAIEAPASALGRALERELAITGALVTELAHDGDAAATEVLALVGRRLGVGIASLVNAFNPELVVVGGGAMAAGELLLGPARAVVEETALRPNRDVVEIVPAALGVEAGMIGAALLALEGDESWPAG